MQGKFVKTALAAVCLLLVVLVCSTATVQAQCAGGSCGVPQSQYFGDVQYGSPVYAAPVYGAQVMAAPVMVQQCGPQGCRPVPYQPYAVPLYSRPPAFRYRSHVGMTIGFHRGGYANWR
jgi:hypothetical protein